MSWYTLTHDDGAINWLCHNTYKDAEETARECAAQGLTCELVETIMVFEADEQDTLEVFNGVRVGVDFPATLWR